MASVYLAGNQQRSLMRHVSSLSVHFDRIMKIIAADPGVHFWSGG